MVKPSGITSHDVVAFIRKTVHMKRVGHTGTLDPDATGVLVLLLGRATRLMQFMVKLPKTYIADIVLGITTDTLDASGRVVSRCEGAKVSKERFFEALSDFRGEIWQVPPMVSAVRHKGRRLYELAREGIEMPREPRKVHIYTLEVQEWPEREFFVLGDRVSILVECSSGTYIRQLAADIGESITCGAHIGSLSRTRVGDIEITSCYTLEEIETAVSDGSFPRKILPVSAGLSHLSTVILTEDDRDIEKKLSCGTLVQARDFLEEVEKEKGKQFSDGDFISIIASSGDVVCVAKAEMIEGQLCLQPVVVFA